MAFRVYAIGQSLVAGSNTAVLWDPSAVTAGCGIELVDAWWSPGTWVIELPPGTYQSNSSVTFTGGPTTSNQSQIEAQDDVDVFASGQGGPGNPITRTLDFVLATTGYAFLTAGPGPGVSTLGVATSSFLEIECIVGNPWTDGRVRWGPNPGNWH